MDPTQLNDTDLLAAYVRKKAPQYGLHPDATLAALQAESGLNPNAAGDGGHAIGIGQLHPAAAMDAGIKPEERSDPQKNIDASLTYMAKLKGEFGGDELSAHGAYMMGPSGYREALSGGGKLPDHVRDRLKLIRPLLGQKPTDPEQAAQPSESQRDQVRSVSRFGLPGSLNGLPSPVDVATGVVQGMGQSITQAVGGGLDVATGNAPTPEQAAGMLTVGSMLVPQSWPITAALTIGGGALMDTYAHRQNDLRTAGQPAGFMDVLNTFSPMDYVRAGTAALIAHTLGGTKSREGIPGRMADTAVPEPPAPLPPPEFIKSVSEKQMAERLFQWKPELWQEARAQLAAQASPGQARVARAYAEIDPGPFVNAADYAERIELFKQQGKSLMPEVESHLHPVLDADGKPTGDYQANVGDVLGMIQDIGRDIWEQYKAGGRSSSVGDLYHLQKDLSNMLKAELPEKQATLLQKAQDAALNANNDRRTVQAVLRYVNPDTGYLNTKALNTYMQTSAGQKLRKMGAEDFQLMQDGARYMTEIQANDAAAHKAIQEKWKEQVKQQAADHAAAVQAAKDQAAAAKEAGKPSVATRTAAGGMGYVAGHAAANALGIPPWIGGGIGARVGYSMAGDLSGMARMSWNSLTSPNVVRLLGSLAGTKIGTTDHSEALGRVLTAIEVESNLSAPAGTEVAPPEEPAPTSKPGYGKPYASPPPR